MRGRGISLSMHIDHGIIFMLTHCPNGEKDGSFLESERRTVWIAEAAMSAVRQMSKDRR
jgi:hypothetical protein